MYRENAVDREYMRSRQIANIRHAFWNPLSYTNTVAFQFDRVTTEK